MTFSELGLSAELEQTVNKLGYTIPTPIQEGAIPQILRGRDIFGCAQTGTGKTASFILPMIDILHGARSKVRMPRSIVLEPTRELAAQVLENFEKYGKDHKLKAALLVGGESMSDQEKQLKRGVDVLIATPGRLLDLFERGQILLADVKILVIDEADRMLDMGFIPDVNRIVATLPKIRQTLLFSATMPQEIKKLSELYLINPKEIIIAPKTRTAATVTQYVVHVNDKNKREILRQILTEQIEPGPMIIFCNRKRDIAVLLSSLKRHGFETAALHGDLAQSQRNQTLEDFKSGKITVLVASDVAARGIDVTGLSLVVNFDVPINAEDYVHRIGRTGRAGNEGIAITLVGPREEKYLAAVQTFIHQTIPILVLSGRAEHEDAQPSPVKEHPSENQLDNAQSDESATKKRRRRRKRGKGPQEAPPSPTSSHAEEQIQEDVIEEIKTSPQTQQRQDRPRSQDQKNDQRPKHRRDQRSRHHQDDAPEKEIYVGFGPDVPAFMLRTVHFKD